MLQNDLFLIGMSGFVAKVHKPMTIGRNWCRIFGDEYRYVAPDQFMIIRSGDEWCVKGCLPNKGPFNQTLVNGIDCADAIISLRNEDLIQIGKLTLRVRIVRRFGDNHESIPGANRLLSFNWTDHLGQNWQWHYNLPLQLVRDAEQEYGLAVSSYTTDYLSTRGFRCEGDRFEIDYPTIVKKNLSRMTEISASLASLGGTLYSSNRYSMLSFFLSFVQSIPYSVPPDALAGRTIYGFLTPLELLYWGFGDCDSKSVLLAALWQGAFAGRFVFLMLPGHLMVALDNVDGTSPRDGAECASIDHRGGQFMLCEAAGPGLIPPGNPGSNFSSATSYRIIDC